MQKVLALGEDRPTPGEILSVESQKCSSQIPAGHVREGLFARSKLRRGWVKPLIEEAMDRNRKTETGRPKPEDRNRKTETGNHERDDPNWVLRRRREWNRLWSPGADATARYIFRKTQDVSGRCHKDFHRPKAASAVIPSHIILSETAP
jgi:hypothetical protein